jgi:hypothetical protein
MTVTFEIGGEIPLKTIRNFPALNRKALLDCLTGRARHFRFSVSDSVINEAQRYFKNIPCPFHVYADNELYAFRPDIRFDKTIDMSQALSDPKGEDGAIYAEKLATNPLPMFQVVKRRVAQWT